MGHPKLRNRCRNISANFHENRMCTIKSSRLQPKTLPLIGSIRQATRVGELTSEVEGPNLSGAQSDPLKNGNSLDLTHYFSKKAPLKKSKIDIQGAKILRGSR